MWERRLSCLIYLKQLAGEEPLEQATCFLIFPTPPKILSKNKILDRM
jgi:hypothetical protein